MNTESTQKHIMHLITKSNFGGAQRYVFDLASALKNDYRVSVAVGGTGVLTQKLHKEGIRTLSIPHLIRDIAIIKEFKVFFALITLFKKEKPDVIHLHSSKVGGLGALAGRVAGVKRIIFTGHGWAFNENRNVISKILIFFLHSLTIVLSHQTIAVSEQTKKQIVRKMPFLKDKITVIYNAVNDIPFLSQNEARNVISKHTNNTDLDIDGFWVGTIGELHHIKGHAHLIYALSELDGNETIQDIQTVIIGEGEEHEELTNKIKKRRLNKRVFLAGRIEDARTLLNAFDIFVFPSLSEAMPYAVLEAGSAGLPIIATRVGGIPEIITHNTSGILVEPKDVFALRDAITTLRNSAKLQQSFSVEIKKDIHARFSHKKMISDTRLIYNQ